MELGDEQCSFCAQMYIYVVAGYRRTLGNTSTQFLTLPYHMVCARYITPQSKGFHNIVNMGRLYSSYPCKCCYANWEGVVAIHISAVSSNTAHPSNVCHSSKHGVMT